jgi:hypothetical protein
MLEIDGDSGASGSTPVCDSGEFGFKSRLSPDDYWLAGLLEGEGSFMRTSKTSGDWRPLIRLHMTDRDVVTRAAAMWGVGVLSGGKGRFDHYKPTFIAKISGSRGAEWMVRLRPLMGERRRGQIDAALDGWVAPRRRLHPQEEMEIVAALRSGERAPVLAARYGIKRESVYHVAWRHGYRPSKRQE